MKLTASDVLAVSIVCCSRSQRDWNQRYGHYVKYTAGGKGRKNRKKGNRYREEEGGGREWEGQGG